MKKVQAKSQVKLNLRLSRPKQRPSRMRYKFNVQRQNKFGGTFTQGFRQPESRDSGNIRRVRTMAGPSLGQFPGLSKSFEVQRGSRQPSRPTTEPVEDENPQQGSQF
jgi:hypothetical protein